MTSSSTEGIWLEHEFTDETIVRKLTNKDQRSIGYNMLYSCILYQKKYKHASWDITVNAVANSYHRPAWKMLLRIECMLLLSLFYSVDKEFLHKIGFSTSSVMLLRLSPMYICRTVKRYRERSSNGDTWSKW